MNKISDLERLERSAAARKRALKTVTYIMLAFWALMVLFPFYWMLLTSVKTEAAYGSETTPVFFTLSPTVENYKTAFSLVPLAKYFLNTVIFTLCTTAIMLVVIIPAAFAFARLKFKGKDFIFTLFLALMMIPNELVIITNYVTVQKLNMYNTFPGLILPSVMSVFYVYLLKENFAQVPDEIYYAAKVDGTSDLKYLFKVMIPVCKPTIVTVTILKVIECWNSYIWPRLVTRENRYLVSIGIQQLRESGKGKANIPGMMAAVTLVSIPLIILFLIFRKKIMEGVARGGTKG